MASFARADLLVTRLSAPRPHPEVVARPRLLAGLGAALHVPLTVVVAPPGYGKSTLLAAWLDELRAGGVAAAWLALDAGDADLADFLRYLVAALRELCPGVGAASLALAEAGVADPSALMVPLINGLAGLAGDAVLVLDDYHAVAEPAAHACLAFLVAHMPPRLHLVIAGRSEPPLPLARLRARRDLIELRAADLRFTAEEAAALLARSAGPPLSRAEVEALTLRAEGWAAGLQLAALALRDAPDRAALIANFGGTSAPVAEYLLAEALDQLPAPLLDFALRTSVLDQLCVELCGATLGLAPETAGQLLAELYRRSLFLSPVDAEGAWLRYHQLFAQLLRDRLLRTAGPVVIAGLRRRAAVWLDRAGLVDDAVAQALAAGDAAVAAGMVARRAAGMIERGELVPLRRWLARLPSASLRADPRLAIAAAMVAIASGEEQRGAELLEAARAADPQQQPPADWLDRTPEAAALVEVTLARALGDAERAADLARAALAKPLSDEPFLRAWAAWELGSAALQLGAVEEARATFATLLAGAPPGAGGLWLQAAAGLGRAAMLCGEPHAALRIYAEALERAGAGRGVGMIHLGLAELHYAQDDLAAAAEHARAALALGAEPPNALLIIAGSTWLARIALARGDAAGAREQLRAAEALRPQLLQPYFLAMLLDDLTQAMLGAGAPERARALLTGEALAETTPGLLAASRIALQAGDYGRALGLAAGLAERAEARGLAGVALEALLVAALACAGLGRADEAAERLGRGLQLALPGGIVRPFLDAGPAVTPLLARLGREHPDGAIRGLASRLLARRADGEPPLAAGEAERLTAREREVLALVAAGRSNGEIAAALVIAPGTVKRHVHSLFAKLAASSRTQLVARARALGLI